MTRPLILRAPHSINASEFSMLIERLNALNLMTNTPLRALSISGVNDALIFARSLLQSLPAHLDEVKHRTPCTSLFELRVALFALIDSDQMRLGEADQLAPLFRVIGVEELEEPLQLWLTSEWTAFDREQSINRLTRVERGLAAIFHSARGHEMFETFSEEDRILLSGPWVRPMMRLAARERFPKQALLALYQSTSVKTREQLIQQFERCRRRVHADPLPTYELLLPMLSFSELNLMFAYWSSSAELLSMTPYMSLFSKEIQRAFDYAACSESVVS